ncbi:hypothetical protein NP233_g11203 [Leucocoprinus birnbaumii]|uniref:Uncharacterized protein n=1 Tax=Leucocoprinus birnbaumii TaxID=56174 RepID=A0AAD5VHU7_9AGAR|nr:hypothetical protein NP233_g11203 [Leucocoprinus birnbaumii]
MSSAAAGLIMVAGSGAYEAIRYGASSDESNCCRGCDVNLTFISLSQSHFVLSPILTRAIDIYATTTTSFSPDIEVDPGTYAFGFISRTDPSAVLAISNSFLLLPETLEPSINLVGNTPPRTTSLLADQAWQTSFPPMKGPITPHGQALILGLSITSMTLTILLLGILLLGVIFRRRVIRRSIQEAYPLEFSEYPNVTPYQVEPSLPLTPNSVKKKESDSSLHSYYSDSSVSPTSYTKNVNPKELSDLRQELDTLRSLVKSQSNTRRLTTTDASLQASPIASTHYPSSQDQVDHTPLQSLQDLPIIANSPSSNRLAKTTPSGSADRNKHASRTNSPPPEYGSP